LAHRGDAPIEHFEQALVLLQCSLELLLLILNKLLALRRRGLLQREGPTDNDVSGIIPPLRGAAAQISRTEVVLKLDAGLVLLELALLLSNSQLLGRRRLLSWLLLLLRLAEVSDLEKLELQV